MYIETMGWGTNGASSCTRVIEVLHESQSDRLIGMVTDRDIVCKGLAQDNFDAGRATARDVMTPGIHCCRDDDDLAKARPTHGGAEGPQIAGDQQEQADGWYPQFGRYQPFSARCCFGRMGQERLGPSLKRFGAFALARVLG
jgi:hypothetical protein